jgi:hypothetical protein
MHIKCIRNINLKATPFYSDIDYNLWKSTINDNNLQDNDDLTILCIQEIYGYRCGIFGFCSNFISHKIPKTYFFKKITNKYNYSDSNLLAAGLSYLNRYIPLLNFGVWDYKKYMTTSTFKYYNNDSISHMFDLCSPFLDGGCCIYSNRKSFSSGFETLIMDNKVSISDYIAKKGIAWSVFDSEDKRILVMTFNLSDDLNELTKLLEIDQIICLQEKLEKRFLLQNFETYIIGDVKINFNERENSFKDILNSFKVINKDTNYVLYKQFFECNMNIDESSDIIKIDVEKSNDEPVFIVKEEEIKEEVIVEVKQELSEDTKEEIRKKGTLFFINNPIYDYFNRLSPSSDKSIKSVNSDGSGEWTKI